VTHSKHRLLSNRSQANYHLCGGGGGGSGGSGGGGSGREVDLETM